MTRIQEEFIKLSKIYYIDNEIDANTFAPVFVFKLKINDNIFKYKVTSESIEKYNLNYESYMIENMLIELKSIARDLMIDDIIA